MPAPKDPEKYKLWIENIGKASKGRKFPNRTEEHKKKLSEANKGKIPWNKGVSPSEKTREKLRQYKLGTYDSEETKNKKRIPMMGNKNTLGFHPTNETRSKMSESHKGEKSPMWKGGKTPLNQKIRRLPKYNEWILSVFTRDNFTCTKCNKRGGDMNAHHIKEFYLIIDENNIKNVEDALSCLELWDINNGITLCEKCHKKEHKNFSF